jgi:shikimate dehydrogenase
VAHSRSPAIHRAALAELGLDGEWSYEAIDVPPERFDETVRSMAAEGFAGANVTVPHKLAALAIAAEASQAATAIGAANTLTFAGDGVVADNTDAAGLLAALGDSPRGKRALVMGAGGAGRAAAWALRSAGAEVEVWNRTPDRAERLAADLGVASLGSADPEPRTADFDLIVNATTVGMAAASGGEGPGLKALPIDADALSEIHVVVDLVYGSRETELERLARERGARVVDGLEVLVRQGAASFRLWTGIDPPVEAMRRAARRPPDAT